MEFSRTLSTLGLLPRIAVVAKLGDFGIVGRRLEAEEPEEVDAPP
jgi:hypothetical protein